MNHYGLQSTNFTEKDAPTDKEPSLSPRSIIRERLREAGVTAERCIPFVDGQKTPPRCFYNHGDHEKHKIPSAIDGSYAVHAGRDLLIVDIDERDELPEQLDNLPETLTIKTPHGGVHLYYTVENDEGIEDTTGPWGEIKYGGVPALGPGSTLNHAFCDEGKDNCPGVGVDKYKLENQPIRRLREEVIDRIRELVDDGTTASGTKSNTPVNSIEYPDESRAEKETEWLCREFLPKRAGRVIQDSLLDILRGGSGSFDWRRSNDSESLDRSRYDYYALSMLYGAFLDRGDDEDEARRNALAVFKDFCLQNEWDETGNRRKWFIKGEQYLDDTMDTVQVNFKMGKWRRRLRREYEDDFNASEPRPWNDREKRNKPSEVTEDTVRAAVWLLSSFTPPFPIDDAEMLFDLDLNTPQTVNKYLPPRRRDGDDEVSTSSGTYRERRYPTAKEVAGLASELNPDRSLSYFEDAVRRLARGESRSMGQVAHAKCPSRPNGHRHVYYWASLPDPEDAEVVKIEGKQLEPGSRKPINEASSIDGDCVNGSNCWIPDDG